MRLPAPAESVGDFLKRISVYVRTYQQSYGYSGCQNLHTSVTGTVELGSADADDDVDGLEVSVTASEAVAEATLSDREAADFVAGSGSASRSHASAAAVTPDS